MKAKFKALLEDALRRTADWLLPPVPGSKAGVPLVFGVTGHRDLRPEDIAPLRAAVRQWLMDYRAAFPTTPFLVMSCLAEGADRLVAEEALSIPSTQLVAVLPLSTKDYEADFEKPSSLEQFRHLLEKSAYIHHLGNRDGKPLSGEDRDEAYRSAGYFVAKSCNVLIALWDGLHNGKTGGTADVVRKKLNGSYVSNTGVLGLQDTLTPPEGGRVLHVLTPRLISQGLPKAPISTQFLVRSDERDHAVLPQSEARPGSDSVSRLTEEFNRSVAARKLDWRTASKKVIAEAPPEIQPALADRASATVGLRELADQAAGGIKKWYAKIAVTNISCGIAAMFLFQFKIIFADYTIGNIFLGIWIAVIAFVWVAFIAIRLLRVKDRQHEYRALAEALRVSGYWRTLGLPSAVADAFLIGQQGHLDWIKKTIRTAALLDTLEGEKRDHSETTLSPYQTLSGFVHRDWVKAQCEYFFGVPSRGTTGAVQRDRSSERNTRRVTFIFVALTVLSLLLLPIAHFIGGKAADLITNIALLIASTAPQAMLAIEIYLDLRAFSLTANRSESIGNWMRRADIFLDKADHKQESTAPIFERLGREALNETSDWLVLHSSRELRPL